MQQNARNTAASASTFRFFGVFFISTPAILFPGTISGHFNAAFFTVRCYLTRLPNQQFINHFNEIIASIILTLQTFLQLKYLGIEDQKDSPFSTHPIVMNVAVYSSAVHFIAYGAVLRFSLHRRLAFLAHHLLVSSGYIAVAALSSIVLPDTAAPFVYAIFGLLSAAELMISLHHKLVKEKEEDEDEAELWIQIWQIRRLFNNIFGNSENSHGQRMPRSPV